jgi:AraC-like DNA-binding protein
VAVSARPAKKVTAAAKAPAAAAKRDVRGNGTARAGTYRFEAGDERVTGWHRHDLHQLEYSFQGVSEVETPAARFLLPPHLAIWIPAGTEHCTTLTRTRTMSVFFDPAFGIAAGDRPRVVPVTPVLREMIMYAGRWPIDRRPAKDERAAVFFTALGNVIEESLDSELALSLPRSGDPIVSAAMDYTAQHLADADLAELCKHVGTSQRSLRRVFQAETGMTWQAYLAQARVLRAMALLSEAGPTVISVALQTGFDSVSGFVRAFRRVAGTTPIAYRRSVLSGEDG